MRPTILFLVAVGSTSLQADNTANLSLYAKGVFAEIEGEKQVARDTYEETLANDADAFPLATKVALVQSRQGDLPAATATLRTFAKGHPGSLPAQLYYADFLRNTAPRDALAQKAALETLKQANRNFPNQPSVYQPLGNIYEMLQQRDQSLALLSEQMAADTEDPYHWFALAPIIKTLYPADSEDYQEGLALVYEKASLHGLGIPDIARAVSEYHRDRGEIGKAIETLQAHLAEVPSSHSLRTRLGLLYLSNGKEEEGEKTLLEVVAIDPDQSLAHQSLARFYHEHGEPLKSLHHRAELFRIDGGSPNEATQLANEYLELDQPHEARLLLEKARFDYPESPAIHARLAIATLRDGATSEAALLFRQAETLAEESKDPDTSKYLDADFQIEFGHSLAEAGDLASAETRLRQAAQNLSIDDHPEQYSRSITALAKLWMQQGKNEGPAKALLERAVSIDPGNEEAKSLLDGEPEP